MQLAMRSAVRLRSVGFKAQNRLLEGHIVLSLRVDTEKFEIHFVFAFAGEGFGTRVVCGETGESIILARSRFMLTSAILSLIGMLFNNGMRIGSTSP